MVKLDKVKKSPPRFSLIMATLGRKTEVEQFVESISRQNFDLTKVELVIVDQNDSPILDEMLEPWTKKIRIIHLKSSIKGLSYNRNLGLKVATGEVFAFPDDDCTFYPETLNSVEEAFQSNAGVNVLIGRIWDRKAKKDIIRSWPLKWKKLGKFNFYPFAQSINNFQRKGKVFFDERFGIGAPFGAGEDIDYLWQLLKSGEKALYLPEIEVWHPAKSTNTNDPEKVYSYGRGVGGLARKNFDLLFMLFFIVSLCIQFGNLFLGIFSKDSSQIRVRLAAIVGRLEGFITFPKN